METKKNDHEVINLKAINQEGSTEFISSKTPQIIAALAVSMGTFALGTALGWSSPAIPNLEEEGTFGILTDSNKSWIGSLVALGAVFSAIVAGIGMQRIGRRFTMILLGIPFVLGWALIAASQNLTMMLIGRFITGFSGGAFLFVGPVYVSEISEDHIRGTLSTVVSVGLTAGILFNYILGAVIPWLWLSIISGIFPLLFMTCLMFVPESPRYLLQKGDNKSAVASLKNLRGAVNVEQIEAELQQIEKSIQESDLRPAKLKDLFEPSVLKPICITCMLMVFQQLGGVNAVIFYTVDIFESAGSDIDSNVATIIVGTVPVIMVSVSAVLVDRAGRKILLIGSAAGMCIGLTALGIYFTLKSNNNDNPPDNLGWLPLASLVFYVITYNVAWGPLPWVIMGELLPPHVKGLAGAIATCLCWGLAFVVTFTFADLLSWLGPEGCYFLFAACSCVGVFFAVFIVPETKGKSLDEIQALFKK